MVASGSRTMIAGSLSSCIAGFHQSCRFSTIIRPETLVRWHGDWFSLLLALEVGPIGRGDRPIDTELRGLIRRKSASKENPLWGAPRIHGELLKLGVFKSRSRASPSMVKRRGPPSQGWRKKNHAPDIAAMDPVSLFKPSVFDLLYAFVIVRLGRRDLVWINVTANPTAEWGGRSASNNGGLSLGLRLRATSSAIRDPIYGSVVTRRLRTMGIRDKPTAPTSPLAEWLCRTADRIDPAWSVWTTSLSWARCICAKSCDLMRTITTASELIDP